MITTAAATVEIRTGLSIHWSGCDAGARQTFFIILSFHELVDRMLQPQLLLPPSATASNDSVCSFFTWEVLLRISSSA